MFDRLKFENGIFKELKMLVLILISNKKFFSKKIIGLHITNPIRAAID